MATTDAMEQQREPACEVCDAAGETQGVLGADHSSLGVAHVGCICVVCTGAWCRCGVVAGG